MQKINKLLGVLMKPYYRKIYFRTRLAASIENEGLLRSLQNNEIGCFVDIGSNRGQFAVVARKNFPLSKIYCFEPLSEPVKVLQNIFMEDVLVAVYELAIGEVEERAELHISKQDDSSSFLPISSLQSEIYPGTEEKETRMVQVKPLDAILTKSDIVQPAFLKIDVQGFEREVLKGCKLLLPCFSFVYVECSFIPLYTGQALAHEVIDFLKDFGFILSGIYNLSYDKDGISVQGDFLFTKNNKP